MPCYLDRMPARDVWASTGRHTGTPLRDGAALPEGWVRGPYLDATLGRDWNQPFLHATPGRDGLGTLEGLAKLSPSVVRKRGDQRSETTLRIRLSASLSSACCHNDSSIGAVVRGAPAKLGGNGLRSFLS